MALEQREVSELYVAIFNRASEGEGNDHWQNLGDKESKATVAEAMIDSPAGKAYFGDTIDSNQDFIELVYENTLGKTVAEDPSGIAFWVGLLNSGQSRGEVITALIEAVQTEESLYPDGIITDDLNDRTPSAVAAQEQFENRVVVSTTLADHVQTFDYLNEDGTVNEQKVKDVVFATSFTDVDETANDGNKDVPHATQGEEGIEDNHGGVEAGAGNAATGSLFVTDNDQTKVNALQSIIDGDFAEVGGVTAQLTLSSNRLGLDDSDNVAGATSDKTKLTTEDDIIDGMTIKNSLQSGDEIIDPSTDDNDKLEANISLDLGLSDGNGDNQDNDGDATTTAGILDVSTISGPKIENVEQITLRSDSHIDTVNLNGIKNNINLNIDVNDDASFNSLNDVEYLEIANLDGDEVQSLNAIDRTKNLAVSDIRNDANIVLNKDMENLVVDAYSEDKFDDSVNIYLEGADFNLGLFDDNDDANSATNDGGRFKEMTLISNGKDSRITLIEGTSLNNITDSSTSAVTASAASVDAVIATADAAILDDIEALNEVLADATSTAASIAAARKTLAETISAQQILVKAAQDALTTPNDVGNGGSTNLAPYDLNVGGRGAGVDDTGIEGSMQTISANDGINNSLLTAKLLLDSEGGFEDITLVGTGKQFDEAVIEEVDEGTATGTDNEQDAIELIGQGHKGTTTTTTTNGGTDTSSTTTTTTVTVMGDEYPATNTGLQSTIELTIEGADEISKTGVGGGVDLTRAQVDLVTIKAKGDEALVEEWMEVNLDQDTVAEVNYIEDLDTLVLTGDHRYDELEVVIDTGNSDAALGRLVLGGDASATTTDAISNAGTSNAAGSGGNEASGSATAASITPDLTTDDAASALITVESDSNLGALDISQISGSTVTLQGDGDLTITELIMGNGGPGNGGDRQANTLDARGHTGDFTANLSALGIKSIGNLDPQLSHDDGNGIDDNAAGAGTTDDGDGEFTPVKDNGEGVTMRLGSGNDFLGNVGVVSSIPAVVVGETDLSTQAGWSHGDNIRMGAGDDVVEIGSLAAETKDQQDDAISAEIWGEEGRDTFLFQSIADTDSDSHKNATVTDDAFTAAGVVDAKLETSANLSGTSLIQIEDFQVGSDGDQIDFNLFRDIDGEGDKKLDVEARVELFHDGEIISGTSANNYQLDDGDVVLISVADISTIDAASITAMFGDSKIGASVAANDDDSTTVPAGGVKGVFEDQDVTISGTGTAASDSITDFHEYVFIVGELTGNDGVKIFYVREGNDADDAAATAIVVDSVGASLIGQLNGNDTSNGVNIANMSDDNFDFL